MLRVSVRGLRLGLHPLVPAAFLGALVMGLGPEAALLTVALGLHELAHLGAAAAYELDVEELYILPFGGQARIANLALADPGVEAVVALAGPVSNLLLFAAAAAAPETLPLDPHLLRVFAVANLSLALFNLVPGLPLDGGRVLRALLAPRMGAAASTRTTVRIGRGAAAALFFLGALLLGRGELVPGCFVLAYLVWSGAEGERMQAAMVQRHRLWHGGKALKGAGAWPVRMLAMPATATLGEAAARLAPRRYHMVVVCDDHLHCLGMLDQGTLRHHLDHAGPDVRLGELL